MNSVNIGIAVVVMIVFLLAMMPQLRAKRMRRQPAPDYSEIGDGGNVATNAALLYFWHPRCGMCKSMGPVLKQVRETFPNVYEINVDDHLALAKQFRIMGTPTLVYIKDNVIQDVMVGAKSAKQIAKRLH